MSANPQSDPRLWCHLILKVAMLYGVCNASLWRHASTFHWVRVCLHVCVCMFVCVCMCMYVPTCTCVCVCVWLGYRVCLHYTLFRLIWLALNRYWFPLFCSLRLSHSLSLPSLLPPILPPSTSGSEPASAKQIFCLPPLFHFCSLVISLSVPAGQILHSHYWHTGIEYFDTQYDWEKSPHVLWLA